MTTTLLLSSKNPFDLPELRRRLSRFVALKDAVSCALVSKVWAVDFIPAVWFKVDFDSHPSFANLEPHTVAKHGHLIRIVKNAKTSGQVAVLANARVNNLRSFHIYLASPALRHIQTHEIIFRNSPCLEDVHLFAPNISLVSVQKTLLNYFSAPALLPLSGAVPPHSSILKMLHLHRHCVTYDSLAMILQGCPALEALELPRTELVGVPTQSFEHTGVKTLTSNIEILFQPRSTVPSLLSYFPRLNCLTIVNFDSNFVIPTSQIKEDLL